MGKFAIECPNCGSINTASTGIFAKKKFPCGTCGKEINSKTGRITSKICPNCESVFVFDQAKAKDRRCPTCGEPVDTSRTATATYKYTTINCPQCACAIEVNKNNELGECPICGMQINLTAELQKQNLVKDGGISVIQYEGNNQTFVWKHPVEDFNYGSQLVVHESQEAVFFMNGQALDTFGPGRHELKTENLPWLKRQYAGPNGAQTPFHAEVYFVNKTVQMGCKWGTDQRVHYRDVETGMDLTIGACGEFNVQVSDARKLLIKLVGTSSGLVRECWDDSPEAEANRFEYMMDLFGATIQNTVKSNLALAIKAQNVSIFDIDEKMADISKAIGAELAVAFEEFGLSVPQFFITRFSLPEEDKTFRDWKRLHAEGRLQEKIAEEKAKSARAARASIEEEELNKDILLEKELKRKKMEAEYNREIKEKDILAEGMAEASVMRAKGYSEKDLIDADVQKAYAAGMGQMGSNAGGGNGGSGVAGDMIGMIMGAKLADNMMNRFDSVTGGGNAAATPAADAWDCACGQKGNTGKFCSGCGQPKAEAWDCTCGQKGNTGKFCANCGSPKPEAWDCSCGQKGITGKFCTNCGSPKPESWDCSCGHKGNTGKFCANCGSPKESPKASGWDCACGRKNNTGNCCPDCGARRPE